MAIGIIGLAFVAPLSGFEPRPNGLKVTTIDRTIDRQAVLTALAFLAVVLSSCLVLVTPA